MQPAAQKHALLDKNSWEELIMLMRKKFMKTIGTLLILNGTAFSQIEEANRPFKLDNILQSAPLCDPAKKPCLFV